MGCHIPPVRLTEIKMIEKPQCLMVGNNTMLLLEL